MRRILIVILFLFPFTELLAQRADSLFVKQSDAGWVISHKVKAGETIFTIARRYHVPPKILSDYNNIPFQQELAPGRKVFVPVGAYNLQTAKPRINSEVKPAYFKVGSERSVARIARLSGVKPRTMQEWNNLEYWEVDPGKVLLVGWILYDETELPMVKKPVESQHKAPQVQRESKIQVTQTPVTPQRRDTFYVNADDTSTTGLADSMHVVTEGERQFLEQTFNEMSVAEEKGTAAFFKRSGISNGGIYFAFHNTAKRGTILKIHNPGTGKTVFAKVIGAVPTTANFYNAMVGISSDARAELGAFESKAWVHVRYAP